MSAEYVLLSAYYSILFPSIVLVATDMLGVKVNTHALIRY